MSYEEIVISVLGVVGTASIISACLTYVFDKRKKIAFREQEYKEMRYKAMVLHMKCLLKPTDLKYMQHQRPDLESIEDVKNEVETEWYNSLLFASDDVIKSLKEFIQKPNNVSYAKTVFAMRKDCWNKKTNLKAEETYL
jgi:hypothetical protein